MIFLTEKRRLMALENVDTILKIMDHLEALGPPFMSGLIDERVEKLCQHYLAQKSEHIAHQKANSKRDATLLRLMKNISHDTYSGKVSMWADAAISVLLEKENNEPNPD